MDLSLARNGIPAAPASPAGLSDIAQQRREQVLTAADEIIASEGIHRLSLGRIEEKTGMSRGQLTYYFPTKEAILMAVFDRTLRRMVEQMMESDGPKPMTGQAQECLRRVFDHLLEKTGRVGSRENDLTSLMYTFLAQMNHREDYRAKLSGQFREWRNRLAEDIQLSVEPPYPIPPRVAACLIDALFKGLTMQLAVDPQAFDREEMLAGCEWLLAPLFKGDTKAAGEGIDPSVGS